MAEWMLSAAAGPESFGNFGSDAPQTAAAAAACAAEPGSVAGSECMLQQEIWFIQITMYPKCTKKTNNRRPHS